MKKKREKMKEKKKKERKSEIHWLPLLDFFLVKSCAWFVSE